MTNHDGTAAGEMAPGILATPEHIPDKCMLLRAMETAVDPACLSAAASHVQLFSTRRPAGCHLQRNTCNEVVAAGASICNA